MKKILTIALLLIAINAQGQGLSVPANATLASLFPDENLRRVVTEVLGPNAGLVGQRLSDALAGIEWLQADYYGINNATGIEYMLGLETLDLRRNNLTSLTNLTRLTNLICLNVSNNNLTTIDISHNIKLIDLDLSNNQLIEIDVSNNINLTTLSVSDNPITTLDISKLIYLEWLFIDNTLIATLDIRNNPKLSTLIRRGSYLTNDNIEGYRRGIGHAMEGEIDWIRPGSWGGR